MDAKQRIRMLRLMEKLKKTPKLGETLGIAVTNRSRRRFSEE